MKAAVALRVGGDLPLAVFLVGVAAGRKLMRPVFCLAVPATKLMTLPTVLTPAVILLAGVDVFHVPRTRPLSLGGSAAYRLLVATSAVLVREAGMAG